MKLLFLCVIVPQTSLPSISFLVSSVLLILSAVLQALVICCWFCRLGCCRAWWNAGGEVDSKAAAGRMR